MKLPLRSKAPLKFVIPIGIAVSAGVLVYAQVPVKYVPPDYLHMKVSNERDDVWLTTKVGSFKILPRGDVNPSGTLTMSFVGSVLISELKGTVVPEGNVRKEYDNIAKGKQVWFGTGKLTIDGSFGAVQWFGRDLNAKFSGNGYMRLYGEFDKNLQTGYYWFDPTSKKYWGNYGTSFGVPEVVFGAQSSDTVKTRSEFDKNKGKTGGG
jgi:hypothetical protein